MEENKVRTNIILIVSSDIYTPNDNNKLSPSQYLKSLLNKVLNLYNSFEHSIKISTHIVTKSMNRDSFIFWITDKLLNLLAFLKPVFFKPLPITPFIKIIILQAYLKVYLKYN